MITFTFNLLHNFHFQLRLRAYVPRVGLSKLSNERSRRTSDYLAQKGGVATGIW